MKNSPLHAGREAQQRGEPAATSTVVGCNSNSEAVRSAVTSFQRTYSLRQAGARSSPAAPEPVLLAGRLPRCRMHRARGGGPGRPLTIPVHLRTGGEAVQRHRGISRYREETCNTACASGIGGRHARGLGSGTNWTEQQLTCCRCEAEVSVHRTCRQAAVKRSRDLAQMVQRCHVLRDPLPIAAVVGWCCASGACTWGSLPVQKRQERHVHRQLMGTHLRQRPGSLGPGSCMDMSAHTVTASCLAGYSLHFTRFTVPGARTGLMGLFSMKAWNMRKGEEGTKSGCGRSAAPCPRRQHHAHAPAVAPATACNRRPWPHVPVPGVQQTEWSVAQPTVILTR